MQEASCLCFPTEIIPNKSLLPSLSPSREHFAAYVSNLDVKIVRGIQNQNSQIAVRRKQLLQQIKEVRSEQNQILEGIRKRENYFEQHYYKFLRDDINRFTKYNEFFKYEFDALEGKIAKGTEDNRRKRLLVVELKAKLMQILKENRAAEISRKPSLSKIAATVQTTATSIRMISEPPDTQRLDKSQKLVKNMSSCKEFPKLTLKYLEPLNRSPKKIDRSNECKHIELMLEVFNFRKQDNKNKPWNWLEEMIYKPRNFEKIVNYLKGKIEYIKHSS